LRPCTYGHRRERGNQRYQRNPNVSQVAPRVAATAYLPG
jgi:hypothetical protein